jgi:chromosome partitioning protein
MKKIAVANSKGGVAKTTTTLSLGCCFAELGLKTLLVDLDHQANLSDDVGRGDEDYTITDLFEDPKFDTNKIVYSALDQSDAIDNLFIIPADITLAVESRSAERFRHRLQILEDGLKRIKGDFDVVLFDCRPAIDLSIENALLISDLLVVPVDIDKRATKGVDDLFDVTKEIKRSDSFLSLIVKTKLDIREKVILRAVEEELYVKGWSVSKSSISISAAFKKATAAGRPFTCFAPDSKQHIEYRELTNEILDMLDIDSNRFFSGQEVVANGS